MKKNLKKAMAMGLATTMALAAPAAVQQLVTHQMYLVLTYLCSIRR